jgi:hypothetical protein
LIVTLLKEFQATRLTRDWPAMRALLHRDAKLESLAAPGKLLSAGELVQAIRTATLRGLYAVTTWRVEPARPKTAFAEARVRYETTPHAFTDEARTFLASELDGLIWRMRIFQDKPAAENCLKANNGNLGI